MTESLIHLRVPAATKGRWVRASRAVGLRLTDYITQAVEAYMQQQLTRVAIPDDIEFSDLKLARDPDGAVSFDWAVIERICHASGLPLEMMRDAPEDNVASLIIGWYQAHRADGGAADPVADDLIAEAMAEDAAGQQFSHQPGRA
ncbi:hypothetical protein BVH74_12110 [Halopseudomonas phragmitis]|uniref:Uncharacterized protein n=2 Tax=Halopseudomonas phragmitis TaxID=1931241 RepID=A0A1V0B6A5_9GAMM|nr:hypothetical protein BVH74_12110 [Halopseudomonas phragmitis]